MTKTGDGARLDQEFLKRFIGQLHTQYFNGRGRLEINVFAQVHIGKAPSPKKPHQPVVPQFLSRILDHHCSPASLRIHPNVFQVYE